MSDLSPGGWLSLSRAGEWLAVSPTGMHRLVSEQPPPLRFRRMGQRRGRWQVEIGSLADYVVMAELKARLG